MKARIWHNPRCSKSRETLAILEATPGIEIEVVEYLKTPPTAAELARLYARAGITPREGLRAGEPVARELGLADAGDDAILDAMTRHPILIERPLVETDKGVRLGRPPEKVREIL
jgi:arsenate reductase